MIHSVISENYVIADLERAEITAIVQDRYGTADVLVLEDIDEPKAASGDVLLRVHAASAHVGDFMTGLPYLFRIAPGSGLRVPKTRVRGTDVAGRVEAIGKDVTQIQPGAFSPSRNPATPDHL